LIDFKQLEIKVANVLEIEKLKIFYRITTLLIEEKLISFAKNMILAFSLYN
jgi:hypothetical protein